MVDKFVIYQTIGRDAGLLAAATALAKKAEDDAPHLITVLKGHLTKIGLFRMLPTV